MKIYTRTGDKGTTSLVSGTRVAKNHPRLDAYGTVDELNSHLGLLDAFCRRQSPAPDAASLDTLLWVQHRLFDLGCMLATEEDSKWQPKTLADGDVTRLEEEIDRLDAVLPRMTAFILPGGTVASAQAQVARTVARRAERQMVTLSGQVTVAPPAMLFVNRLSDWLFVFARYLNHISGQPETVWQ